MPQTTADDLRRCFYHETDANLVHKCSCWGHDAKTREKSLWMTRLNASMLLDTGYWLDGNEGGQLEILSVSCWLVSTSHRTRTAGCTKLVIKWKVPEAELKRHHHSPPSIQYFVHPPLHPSTAHPQATSAA